MSILFKINAVLLNFVMYFKESWKRCRAVLNIDDNNKKCFLTTKSAYWNIFWSNDCWIFSFAIKGI